MLFVYKQIQPQPCLITIFQTSQQKGYHHNGNQSQSYPNLWSEPYCGDSSRSQFHWHVLLRLTQPMDCIFHQINEPLSGWEKSKRVRWRHVPGCSGKGWLLWVGERCFWRVWLKEGRDGEKGLYLSNKLASGLRDRPVFSPGQRERFVTAVTRRSNGVFRPRRVLRLGRSHALLEGRLAETLFHRFHPMPPIWPKVLIKRFVISTPSFVCLPYSWLCMLTRFSFLHLFFVVVGEIERVHSALFCWSAMYLRPKNHTPQMAWQKSYSTIPFCCPFYLRIESVRCVLWIILLGTWMTLSQNTVKKLLNLATQCFCSLLNQQHIYFVPLHQVKPYVTRIHPEQGYNRTLCFI